MEKILIIDDDPDVRYLFRRILSSLNYIIEEAKDGTLGIEKALIMEPDLIIMDYMLPGINGLEASREIKKRLSPSFVYIIMVTAKTGKHTEIESLSYVDDYIEKPIDVDVFISRIKVGLRFVASLRERDKILYDRDIIYQQFLDLFTEMQGMFREKESLYEEMRNTIVNLSIALSEAVEGRDRITAEHINRVANCSLAIAKELGLDDQFKEDLKYAAIFHDLGKIGIPDRILMKPGKLTPEEFEIMKEHTNIGFEILKQISFFENVLPAIKYHHERVDGKGYPDGLRNGEIPLVAKIVAVADAYDVITHTRPYKEKQSKQFAIEEIQRNAGKQFDEKVVDALMHAYKKEIV